MTLVILPFALYSLSIRSSPRDRWLGNMAYPMYLVHWVVPVMLAGLMARMSPAGSRLLDILVVFVASAGLEFLLDRPAERFRERFVKRAFTRHPTAGDGRSAAQN
jgi:peptidoglycan/LPS O-acetylase OafA/YrhL